MSIWFNKHLRIEDLEALGKGTMSAHIGIEWVELGDNFIRARMPVDHRTRQPYGLLHGGASVVLAETIGSVAAAMVTDTHRFTCVGISIHANHVRSVKAGWVTGIATPLHLGATTQVWDISIFDEREKLVNTSRLTVAVLKHKATVE